MSNHPNLFGDDPFMFRHLSVYFYTMKPPLTQSVPFLQVSVAPQMGRLCLHWTGHDFLHEGALVTKGTKYLLRTDLFFPK
jgi:hypothetical protein